MHGDGDTMDDDTTRIRELQALSFNPFGDSFSAAAGTGNNDLDRKFEDGNTDDVTHRLGNLRIPSPMVGGGRSSSNTSSAISTHTNPLFDLVEVHHAGSAKSGGIDHAAVNAAAGSGLNPAAGPYSPAASTNTSHSATSNGFGKPNSIPPSPSVSIIMGSGAAPIRRHRLSSASSVKSTRSRRSTSSSLSSIIHPQPDGENILPDVAEARVAGSVSTGSSGNSNNGGPHPPPTARPIMETSNSQDSMLSLQPSVMSLETTATAPPPVAGYRIPATGSLRHSSFPQLSLCGPAFRDFDQHPIYVCSAILGTAIHPAKAGPHLSPPVRMSFAGKEILHEGRFDLLPITPDMKWCDAKDGIVPEGREPIQAGYEESGEQLHHALARIQGFWVPGKTGTHLKGANFPFAGREVRMREGYKILCWAQRGGSVTDSDTTEVPHSDQHVVDNYVRNPAV